MMERFGEDVLDSSPNLQKLIDHINNIPQIKKYISTRSKTTH